MKNYKTLKVWDKAHQSTLNIYMKTKSFPVDERFGLTSQIRRSSVSIPANIAEGCGKFSDKDFARYLQISLGSTHETEYYILLAKELGYFNELDYTNLNTGITEVKSMLISLLKKLRN
jgi:four helix bundle protein